jgi:hypothetical protein
MGMTYAETKDTADGTYYNSGIIIGTNWLTNNFNPTGTTVTCNNIHDNYGGLSIQSGVTDANVENNQLSYNRYCGVIVQGDGDGSGIHINCNEITGNGIYGVKSERATFDVDAECNWWGDASGPREEGPGTGDAVSTNVDFDPWSFTPDPCEAKTLGFWKTHGDSVDAVLVLAEDGQIDLGGFTVEDSDDATAVFNNAKNKNANTMLAAQLLAAKLNVLHLAHLGIDYCDGIGTVITAAEGFLSNHGYNGPDDPGEAPRGADKQEANGYKDDLDEYNEGLCT